MKEKEKKQCYCTSMQSSTRLLSLAVSWVARTIRLFNLYIWYDIWLYFTKQAYLLLANVLFLQKVDSIRFCKWNSPTSPGHWESVAYAATSLLGRCVPPLPAVAVVVVRVLRACDNTWRHVCLGSVHPGCQGQGGRKQTPTFSYSCILFYLSTVQFLLHFTQNDIGACPPPIFDSV